MHNGAAYIRVSTDEQKEFSPDAQKRAILKYAESNNIKIENKFIFIDEGFSGRKAEKRPAFMEMIHTAKQTPKPFDIILVHKFDRFSRNRTDSVIYKSLLKKEYGIKVISITEQLEDDKFSVIMESMLEAMAEYYSLNLADEVKKGMTEKALKGQYQAYAPFGYENKNKNLSIIPEQSKIIKYIFDQYLNENKSFYQISQELSSINVKTKKGNPINSRAIEYILQNPIYCGYVRWTPTGKIHRNFNNPNSIIAKSDHKAIISKKTFELTQKKIIESKNKSLSTNRPYIKHKHWILGLVKCSNCGRNLVIYRSYKNGSFSLQCSGYNHGQCNVSHSISSNILIPLIINELDKIINNSYFEEYKYFEAKNFESEIYINQIKKLNLNLKKARQAFLNGIDTEQEYKKLKEELQQKLNSIKQKNENLIKNNNSYNSLKNKYNLLKSEDVCEEIKIKIAKRLIQKIIYNKQENLIELFLYCT